MADVTVNGQTYHNVIEKIYDPDYHTYDAQQEHRRPSANLNFADGALHYFLATSKMTEGKPSSDGRILHLSWDNGTYEGQLSIPTGDPNVKRIQWRNLTTTGWTGWYSLLQDTDMLHPVSGNWFRGVPEVSSDGVMEIGRYIDFHITDTGTTDYDIRLRADTNLLTCNKGMAVSGATNSNTLSLYSPTVATGSCLLYGLMKGNQQWIDLMKLQAYDMQAAQNASISFGKAFNAKNSGNIMYCHVGDGSNNNRVSIGLTQCDFLLNVLANGNVGIGTTAPTTKLHVSGGTKVEGTLTTGDISCSGTITATGSITGGAFYQSSDKALKENIEPIEAEKACKIISQINPVTFNWKKDGSKGQGVIAQELEEILPEAVKEYEHKTVDYIALIPYMIKMIQTQQETIQSQQLEIIELKNRLDNLEK